MKISSPSGSAPNQCDVCPWAVRSAGSDEENARAVRDTLVVLGTYTVDADGVFKDEEVLRSSFPNWNGKRRDSRTLTETVEGDVMTEHLDDGEGVVITISFSREQPPA